MEYIIISMIFFFVDYEPNYHGIYSKGVFSILWIFQIIEATESLFYFVASALFYLDKAVDMMCVINFSVKNVIPCYIWLFKYKTALVLWANQK